jgi:hypothetical protein
MAEKKGEMDNLTEKNPLVATVMSKPLPQILDEMDDNIRAAAEAARKAEDAARAAKDAAAQATKALAEAEKMAKEARKAGQLAAETATIAAVEAARKVETAAKKAVGAANTAKSAQKAVEESILAISKELIEAKKYTKRIQEHETSLLNRIEILEKKFKKLEIKDHIYEEKVEYESVNGIISMSGKTDPVLEQIWGNPIDAAYDKL